MGGWSTTPSSGAGFTGTYGSGTLTANTPITFTQTWNNAAIAFTGQTVNITNTASSAASLLLDLQVGGASQFKVDKSGRAFFAGGAAQAPSITIGSVTSGFYSPSSGNLTFTANNGDYACFSNGSGVTVAGNVGFAWSASTGNCNTGNDTQISRNAAGIVEVNNGTPGTYRDLLARNVRTNPTTVASLTAAATAGAGARSFVTDATSSTFAAAVVGGGSTNVPVFSDGSAWRVG